MSSFVTGSFARGKMTRAQPSENRIEQTYGAKFQTQAVARVLK
jgi:hypothetical protein